MMGDVTDFSVHRCRRLNHSAAERLADALMPEADAEDWQVAGTDADEFKRNSSPVGIAGAWRNDDALRPHSQCFSGGQNVIPSDFDFDSQFPEKVIEVVCKAVVIVDEKKHFNGLTGNSEADRQRGQRVLQHCLTSKGHNADSIRHRQGTPWSSNTACQIILRAQLGMQIREVVRTL